MTILLPQPTCLEIFDQTHDGVLRGDTLRAMGELRHTLARLRSHLPPTEWAAVGEQARQHPLHRVLLESPFTRRAYEKPSEKRVREKAEAVRRHRKAARKQAQREGLLPAPKRKPLAPRPGAAPRRDERV